MTFDEYCDEVERAAVDCPDQSDGEVAFAILASCRPDLSVAIRGSRMDPRLRDSDLLAFAVYVKNHWDPLPA